MLNDSTRKRRWYQFSLTTVLLGLTLGCVLLGWWRDHRQLRGRVERDATLIEMLRSEPEEVSRSVLAGHVPRYDAPEQFIADLENNQNWSLQNVLVVRGSKIGESAVPSLVELLKAEHPETRVRAAGALGQMRCQSKVVVPALLAAIDHPDPRFHYSVVASLRQIGPEAKEAVPTLLKALGDPAEAHPAAVAAALWSINSDPRAVDELIELLGHKSPSVRSAAADYLHNIGPANTQRAVPTLLKACHDKDATVRCVALSALVDLVPAEHALDLLAAAGTDNDPHVRRSATELLNRLNANVHGPLRSERSE